MHYAGPTTFCYVGNTKNCTPVIMEFNNISFFYFTYCRIGGMNASDPPGETIFENTVTRNFSHPFNMLIKVGMV